MRSCCNDFTLKSTQVLEIHLSLRLQRSPISLSSKQKAAQLGSPRCNGHLRNRMDRRLCVVDVDVDVDVDVFNLLRLDRFKLNLAKVTRCLSEFNLADTTRGFSRHNLCSDRGGVRKSYCF